MSRGGFADDPISVGPGSCSGKNTPLNANIAILARSGPRNLRIKREREARTRRGGEISHSPTVETTAPTF